MSPSRLGVLLYPKPAGVTSHDVVASVRRELERGHEGRPRRHARSVRHRSSARARGPCHARAAFLLGLPKTYRAVARLGWRSDTGDRDGQLEQTGRMPERLELATGDLMQAPHAYSAVQRGRRARLTVLARRGEAPELEPRPVTVYRAELVGQTAEHATLRDRVLGGHVRAQPGRGARGRLLRGARAHGHRPVPAGGRRPGAPGRRSPTRSGSCRSASLDELEHAAVRHGRRLPAPAAPKSRSCASPARASSWPWPSPGMASSGPS